MVKNVYVEGTWDLLHYNHIEFLNEARSFGDRLVVGVMSDRWVVGNKMKKPIFSEDERLRTINSLSIVDESFLHDGPITQEMMIKILDKYQPVAVVYGSSGYEDYFAPALERGVMRRLKYRPGISSTEIVSRIINNRDDEE